MCIKHLNQLKFGLSCLKINYRYALLDLFPLVNVYLSAKWQQSCNPKLVKDVEKC